MRMSGAYVQPEQIYDKVRCRICRQMIEDEEEYVVTSDFFKPGHPLWHFANAAMHSKCFYFWAERDEFLSPKDIVRDYRFTRNFIRILCLYRLAENAPRQIVAIHRPIPRPFKVAGDEQAESDRIATG